MFQLRHTCKLSEYVVGAEIVFFSFSFIFSPTSLKPSLLLANIPVLATAGLLTLDVASFEALRRVTRA